MNNLVNIFSQKYLQNILFHKNYLQKFLRTVRLFTSPHTLSPSTHTPFHLSIPPFTSPRTLSPHTPTHTPHPYPHDRRQVCACANDGDSSVREAAARCITQFADHLQPEILDHHAVVLPQLFKCLGMEMG